MYFYDSMIPEILLLLIFLHCFLPDVCRTAGQSKSELDVAQGVTKTNRGPAPPFFF